MSDLTQKLRESVIVVELEKLRKRMEVLENAKIGPRVLHARLRYVKDDFLSIQALARKWCLIPR